MQKGYGSLWIVLFILMVMAALVMSILTIVAERRRTPEIEIVKQKCEKPAEVKKCEKPKEAEECEQPEVDDTCPGKLADCAFFYEQAMVELAYCPPAEIDNNDLEVALDRLKGCYKEHIILEQKIKNQSRTIEEKVNCQ